MSEEKKKILIIDDERAFSVMLQLNLSSWEQYEVIIENDSRNALKTALQFIPDLVLLDVIMPHLEGPDVAGQFKIEPQLKNIPIIFLTATVTHEEVEENKGMIGGHPFISKPSEIDTIVDLIEQYT